ncbi:MAG TPA: CPBP family intramembrane glutamic endopeptidase [Terriglobia bacterium]|nr:CPBP family intramembrane glutamic endopeptidase [Terriglobia bacterium]
METQDPASAQDRAGDQQESPLAEEPQLAEASSALTRDRRTPVPTASGFFEIVFVGPGGIRPGWRLCIWAIAAGTAGFVFGGLAALMVRHAPAETQPLGVMFGDGIPFVGVLAATILMSRIERRTLADYALPVREAFGSQFWQGVLWGLSALSLLLGAIHLCHGFDLGGVALTGGTLAEYAVLWAIAFLVVGLFEESVMRAYALFTLTDGIRFWPAAGLLSGAFGAIHLGNRGEDWIGVLAAALIGLFFCFTVRRTGSLWFAVGMHFAWDYAESFIYSVPDSGVMVTGHLLNSSFHGPAWLTGGTVGPEASVFVFVIIAALFVAFGLTHRDIRFPRVAAVQPLEPARTSLRDKSPLGFGS